MPFGFRSGWATNRNLVFNLQKLCCVARILSSYTDWAPRWATTGWNNSPLQKLSPEPRLLSQRVVNFNFEQTVPLKPLLNSGTRSLLSLITCAAPPPSSLFALCAGGYGALPRRDSTCLCQLWLNYRFECEEGRKVFFFWEKERGGNLGRGGGGV